MDTTFNMSIGEDQPLDVTPVCDNVNMMDPYELFSTPPSEMVLSSTPSKPKGRRGVKAPNSARKAVLTKRLAANKRASISFDAGRSSDTSITSPNRSHINRSTTRVLRNRNVNKDKISKTVGVSPASKATKQRQTNNNGDKKTKDAKSKQPSSNLWDQCLKSNPGLAQFVNNFNHSLEEALSKPLDMSGNE